MLQNNVVLSIWDFLFPTQCCHCHRTGPFLCSSCYAALSFTTGLIENTSGSSLDAVMAAVSYEGPVRSLLHALKYQSVKAIGVYCGQLLFYTAPIPTVDLVTAVPLHRDRQRWRGFNQSQVIAETLAQLLNLPYFNLLERHHFTQTQASLSDPAARQQNVAGSFQLSSSLPNIDVNQKQILLIDDVTTTGATLNECASVLIKAGATAVYGLTVAHGS